MPESRPVSGLEVKWIAAHRIQPPFAIDFVAELDGRVVPGELERAWDEVVSVHLGLRVRLKGRLARRRWVADGASPPLIWLDHPGWDARQVLPAPLFGVTLDPEDGPVALLAVVPGDVPGTHTLVLRVLHAVTDGRGGLAVLSDLFTALRGESLGPSRFLSVTDTDLSRRAGGSVSPPPSPDRAPQARVSARPGAKGGGWVRTTLPAPDKAVYGAVVAALARWPERGPLRYTLPVDLRRHQAGLPETVGNLTGLVHLDVHELALRPDAPVAIREALRRAVDRGAHHGPVLESDAMRRLPLALTSGAGGALSRRDQRRGLVPVSATVSNLGRLDLARWGGGGVQARTVFVAPPASPGLPLLAVMTGNNDRVEVAGAVPSAWGPPDAWTAALRP